MIDVGPGLGLASAPGGALVTGTHEDTVAFIWDSAHGTRSLQDVLTAEYGLDLSGWTLRCAGELAHDDTKLIGIAGYGNNLTTGYLEAWVVVPEPATLGLLVVGALGLLRRRRRAR